MLSKVQRIWHQSESKQMCIYGIFKDDFGFYYFHKKETTRSKEIRAIVNNVRNTICF